MTPQPDQLIEQAINETGLDDFGGDSFREGLDVLVRSLREEARLNPIGEALLYPRIVAQLKSRLQVEDWYQQHPDIDDVRIERPLFGLGLPRTGSTALSFLLAQDPNVRFLRQWESAQPCPPPSTVPAPDPRLLAAIAKSEALASGVQGHIPTDPDGPVECLELMALDFKTQMYHALARVPSYADWVIDADLTSAYGYEKRVLKLLQWGEIVKPWRLKTPAHMLWIESLADVFPDARFVMTHRDPTDVILSVCDLYADIVAPFTEEVDLSYIAQINVEQWTTAVERVLKFRDSGNDGRFYDIDFRAMRADPIGEVRALYEWLGEPVDVAFESNMRRWWELNAANREPSAHSNPSRYGLDLEEVRPRFAEYVTRAAAWTAS